jgi:hypothetical protein
VLFEEVPGKLEYDLSPYILIKRVGAALAD